MVFVLYFSLLFSALLCFCFYGGLCAVFIIIVAMIVMVWIWTNYLLDDRGARKVTTSCPVSPWQFELSM